MIMASYLLVKGRRVESLDAILNDLSLNLKQITSNETHLNTAKMFIHCAKDASLSE